MPPIARVPSERFWSHVDKAGRAGCWLWTGHLNQLGYARFFLNEAPGRRTSMPAPRFAYEQVVGPVPVGKVLDHLCRVRHCVNPAHLEPVTQRENMLRSGLPNGALSKRTHCGRGHLFDEENTYYRPDGGRRCRKCAWLQVQRSGRRYEAERTGRGLEVDQEAEGWDAAKLRHELRLLRAENVRLRAALAAAGT